MISKSCLLCGLLYIVIFLPLTIYSSEIQGLNPLAIILFSRVPDALVENFRTNFFPIVTIRGASPFVYACGLAYGVNGLGVYLVSKLSSPTIKIKSGLTAKGIFGGYFISLIIIDFFSKSVDFWTYNGRLFFLRISYVIFFFFLIELTKDCLPQKWFVKSKYDFFFDGLYGIISTYIIGYGFAEEVSFIITGPLFIFCALITSYSENFIIGFFADIVVNFIKIEERLNTMLCNMDRTFPSRTIADIQKSQKLSFLVIVKEMYRGIPEVKQRFRVVCRYISMCILHSFKHISMSRYAEIFESKLRKINKATFDLNFHELPCNFRIFTLVFLQFFRLSFRYFISTSCKANFRPIRLKSSSCERRRLFLSFPGFPRVGSTIQSYFG